MIDTHVIVYRLSSDTALLTSKTVCSQAENWLFRSAKNALNLVLSTTSISQQHCVRFQTQTGEMAPRSKVAHGVNHVSVMLRN